MLPNYAGFLFVAIASTFLYTWIFNHTRGSVLLATLIHGFGDAVGGVVALLIPTLLVVGGWAAPIVNGSWQGSVSSRSAFVRCCSSSSPGVALATNRIVI